MQKDNVKCSENTEKENSVLNFLRNMFGNKVKPRRDYCYLIIGNWNGGGLCPWQMYLPIYYEGQRYTIYLRERHDVLSCHIFKGKISMRHRDDDAKIVSPDLFEKLNEYKIPPCISTENLAENLVDEYIRFGQLEVK